MRSFLSRLGSSLIVAVGLGSAVTSFGQEVAEVATETTWPLDADGHLVRFDRDIAPILRSKCLECHGPDEAKNDFRVDDRDMMMNYVEPSDVESSSLYTEYLTIDDEEMLMPPKSHGGPLLPSELALIRVWIEEGANWPEEFAFTATDPQAAVTAPVVAAPKSTAERVWTAQGFLHPATVHFPIALLTVGALFVVIGWMWPSVGTQIPLACLLLGAASAVVATLMGWAFAPQQGYGASWNMLDWDREVDAHRWSGVIVSIAASVFALIALFAVWRQSESLTRVWKIGLLICAAMVGAVGHQGGEMSYGSDFYPKAWRILTGQTDAPAPPVEAVEVAPQAESAEQDLGAEPQ